MRPFALMSLVLRKNNNPKGSIKVLEESKNSIPKNATMIKITKM